VGVRIDADHVRFPASHRGAKLAAAVVLLLGGVLRGAEVVLRGEEPLGIAAAVAAVALGVVIVVRTRRGPWVDTSGWHAPGRGRNRLIPWAEVTKVRVVGTGDRAVWGLETEPDRGPLTRWTSTELDEVADVVAKIRPWADDAGTEVVDLTHWDRRDRRDRRDPDAGA
jgi:hypothetical protein